MMVVVVVSMRMRTVMFWRVRFGSKFSFAGCFACFSVSSDGFHSTAENVQFHSQMKNSRQWSFLRHVSQPDVAECIVMACIHLTLHWAWLWQPWVSIAVWILVGSNFALRVFENFLGQEPLVAVLRSGVTKLKCFCGGFGNWFTTRWRQCFRTNNLDDFLAVSERWSLFFGHISHRNCAMYLLFSTGARNARLTRITRFDLMQLDLICLRRRYAMISVYPLPTSICRVTLFPFSLWHHPYVLQKSNTMSLFSHHLGDLVVTVVYT